MVGGTTTTDLEYEIIRKFCELESTIVPSRDDISVARRDRNPVGFMTDISIGSGWGHRWPKRIYEGIPPARVRATGDMLGFVMYFSGSDISIEGFIYGEAWPAMSSR